jgi:hypothetical protein
VSFLSLMFSSTFAPHIRLYSILPPKPSMKKLRLLVESDCRYRATLQSDEDFQGVFARNSEWLLDALSSDSFAALADTRRVDHFRTWVEHDANEIIGGFTGVLQRICLH